MACAICETRKEKRFCPARHERICALCCGTEREVSIDCPPDCPHLVEARKHEAPREVHEILDRESLFPQIELNRELVHSREPLLAGLSYALAQSSRRDRTVTDCDLIAALTALAKSYEMLVTSGLVLESRTPNPVHQAIGDEVHKMIAGYREIEKQQKGSSSLANSDLLQVLVFLVRLGLARTNGRPRSRAFISLLQKQFQDRGDIKAEEPSKLIVP